jgi:hypothetical protein
MYVAFLTAEFMYLLLLSDLLVNNCCDVCDCAILLMPVVLNALHNSACSKINALGCAH